jgi:ketosteroid isomerase-like protein
MRQIPLLGLLTVAIVGFATSRETVSNKADSAEVIEKEILHVEEVQDQAILKGDVKVLDRIYADDFAYMNQFGELIPRSQVLAGFRSGKARLSSMKHDDIQIRVYGDTVVLTGRSVGTFYYKGKVSPGPRRFTNVYVKLGGRWQLVSHQATDVAKE